MKKLALLAIGVLILFTSCDDNIKIDFDNPTKTAQKVTFDGEEFTLWALGTVTKQVPRGEHTLQIGTDSVMTYDFKEDEYLVNPSRATYIIEKVKYSTAALAEFQNKFNELNGDVASNFEVFDDLIKVRNWDFKQREDVPETMTFKSSSASTTKRKLYAPDELEEMLKNAKN